MEFGELRDIELQKAWPHEAFDFTPWLAENLPRLTRVIGIDLELIDTEVDIEGFKADILASNALDGSRVLIENQLNKTDHTHLGQILTYLAGLEARTVLWIARDFHQAHLSAIRWLNTHTESDFAFLAVKVRAVQIGDSQSPIAPLFEVIERPNDWDRQVKSTSKTGGLTTLGTFRRDFWQLYSQRYPDDRPLTPGYAVSNVYETRGDILISQFVLYQKGVGIFRRWSLESFDSQDRDSASEWRDRGCCCDWCCTVCDKEGCSCSDKDCYCEVCRGQESRRELAGAIRRAIDLGGREASYEHVSGVDFVARYLRTDSQDRENWPQMADWLHDRLTEYRDIIGQHLTQ